MAQVYNPRMTNRRLVVMGKTVEFDGNGVASVDDSIASALTSLNGYSTPMNPEVPAIATEEFHDTAEPAEAASDAAKPEADDASATTDILESMNVPQLCKYAKENGIDLGDARKKADILRVISG